MTTFTERRRIARAYLNRERTVDVGLADQLAAAHRDAYRDWWLPALPVFAARGGRTVIRPLDDALEAQELLVAAGMDCSRCVHLRKARGPMPVIVALALRLALCDRCARTVRKPPADEADRCDICGSRGNATFTPFRTVAGTTVFLGDAGNCCASQILAGAATT